MDDVPVNPFLTSLLTMKVYLSIIEIGKNVADVLRQKIRIQVEGKCIKEGLVVPGSIKIIRYSAGKVNMEDVEFQVTYECSLCFPVEGMVIECVSKTITKAGIYAEYNVDNQKLISVYFPRDDNYDNKNFLEIKPEMTILAKITGVTYELNDSSITVTAELV
jgi:DNA-directed RNA polymerase subunit E'/Rpb7